MYGSGNAYSTLNIIFVHFDSCWNTNNTRRSTRSFPSAPSDNIKHEIVIIRLCFLSGLAVYVTKA